jgi:aminoglycoside phosphotransferase (APT) family kinase protein
MQSPERTTRHLIVIREACHATLHAMSDPGERRRLEQVCQVLTRLIVESRDLPSLRSEATAAYTDALARLPQLRRASAAHPAVSDDFAVLRAQIQNGLAAQSRDFGTDFLRDLATIERHYFQGFDRAFRTELANAATVSPEQGVAAASLDAAALERYLREIFGASVAVTSVETMALGYSKLTLLVKLVASESTPEFVVLRMDRPFNYLGTTVVDEFPTLKALNQRGIRAPLTYALEASGKVLGQPFLIMQRVSGRNIGSHFTFPEPDPELCRLFAQQLAAIHSVPSADLPQNLKGRGQSAATQFDDEFDKYYRDWSELNSVSPVIEAAFHWIKRHKSLALGERCLVHGDFSLSNVLIEERRITGVLDWEFARFAPPAADMGWFFYAATRLGSWQGFLDAYADTGVTLPDRQQLDFYVLWGVVKLAVMNYQLDAGIDSGRSSDIKHAFAAAAFLREITLRVADRLQAVL